MSTVVLESLYIVLEDQYIRTVKSVQLYWEISTLVLFYSRIVLDNSTVAKISKISIMVSTIVLISSTIVLEIRTKWPKCKSSEVVTFVPVQLYWNLVQLY